VLALALFSLASWQTANADLQALRARRRALPSVGFRSAAARLSEAMNSYRNTQQTDAHQSNSGQTDIRTSPVKATWNTDAGEEAGPRAVHCEREAFDIYCGRGSRKLGLPRSKWANPFRIGRDGTREQVIAKHRQLVLSQPQLLAALQALRGQTLGCHCAPEPCHCDTLVELANAPQPPAPTPAISHKGQPHAHLGYRAGQERRLIVVQRIHGAIRVGDLPADGKGERYLVADSLETCGELDALLLHYTSQASELGVIPASPAGVRHTLDMAA